MARRNQTRRGDIPALLALMGMTILFVFIVTRGWQTLLSSYGLYVSIFAALFIALIAVVLSWAIASERVINPARKTTALAYFFVLFNISALGTVNAMLVMFQSTNVFREEIDKATESIIALRDYGKQSINIKEYETFKASVNDKWRNLKAEIENPAMCGQGPVAAARIVELQQLLPNFRTLAGSGKCEKIPVLIASYEKQVEDLTKESKIYIQNKPKLDVIEKIDSKTADLLNTLNQIRRDLNNAYSMATVKASLHNVAEEYSLLRQEMYSVGVAQSDKIPSKIDVKSISALGDIGQILPFIVSRLGDISTYIYLAIALILDIALISAFGRVISTGPSANQRRAAQTLRRF